VLRFEANTTTTRKELMKCVISDIEIWIYGTDRRAVDHSTLLKEIQTSAKLCKLNPLNAELKPICHLLALQGAHHILHLSRIRVNTVFTHGWSSEVTNWRRIGWEGRVAHGRVGDEKWIQDLCGGNLQGRENLEELREMWRGSVHVSSFPGVGTAK